MHACRRTILPVPQRAEEQVAQAAAAVRSAYAAGVKRQRLELLLPVTGATDLDDCACDQLVHHLPCVLAACTDMLDILLSALRVVQHRQM